MLSKSNFVIKELAMQLFSTLTQPNGNIKIRDNLYACLFKGQLNKSNELSLYDKILYDQNTLSQMIGIENTKKLKITDKIIEGLYLLEVEIPLKFGFPSYYLTNESLDVQNGKGMIVTRLGLLNKEGCDINDTILQLKDRDISFLRKQYDVLQYDVPELGARMLEDIRSQGALRACGWTIIKQIFNTKNENEEQFVNSIVSRVVDPKNTAAIKTAKDIFQMNEIPNEENQDRHFIITREKFNEINECILKTKINKKKVPGFKI